MADRGDKNSANKKNPLGEGGRGWASGRWWVREGEQRGRRLFFFKWLFCVCFSTNGKIRLAGTHWRQFSRVWIIVMSSSFTQTPALAGLTHRSNLNALISYNETGKWGDAAADCSFVILHFVSIPLKYERGGRNDAAHCCPMLSKGMMGQMRAVSVITLMENK